MSHLLMTCSGIVYPSQTPGLYVLILDEQEMKQGYRISFYLPLTKLIVSKSTLLPGHRSSLSSATSSAGDGDHSLFSSLSLPGCYVSIGLATVLPCDLLSAMSVFSKQEIRSISSVTSLAFGKI